MAAYRQRLRTLTKGLTAFADLRDKFLEDRYGASHILKPVLDGEPSAFFTNGDDAELQGAWAREMGMAQGTSLDEILLAQIEEHRSEVFYNTDPVRYGSDFLRRIPDHVRHRFAWRAAPSGQANFQGYDLMLCNFPSILASFKREGLEGAWFFPAHDPVMEDYATSGLREVDIAFIGTYSRHHRRRAALIEAVAGLRERFNVALHLDSSSRFLRLAESPLGLFGPLRKHRRPADVRRACADAVFGRELYQVLGATKIVVNGAIDMSGDDRGNMRCWEAMGAGALLLTDRGNYPEGMIDGETMVTYDGVEDLVAKLHDMMSDPARTTQIARQGQKMIRTRYSKEVQIEAFAKLIDAKRA